MAAAREAKQQAASAAQQERGERFQRAVEKANWASQMLKTQPASAAAAAAADDDTGAIDPDADDELYQSLERARRLAQQKEGAGKKSVEELAAGLAKRREEDEARLKQELVSGVKFTETTEFVRSIQLAPDGSKGKGGKKGEEGEDEVYTAAELGTGTATGAASLAPAGSAAAAAPDASDGPEAMDVDEPKASKFGKWVSADAAEQQRAEQRASKGAKEGGRKEEVKADEVTVQAAVGKGGWAAGAGVLRAGCWC